jgi:Flp pilus assembly protein TadD
VTCRIEFVSMSNRFLWSRLGFGQALPSRDREEAVLTFWLRQATSGMAVSREVVTTVLENARLPRLLAVLLLAAVQALTALLGQAVPYQDDVLRQAETDLKNGRIEDARQALTQALEKDPSWTVAHILLGRISLQSDELDKAAAEFTLALRLGDDAAKNAQYGMGLVLLQKPAYKDAVTFLTAAVEAQPKDLPRLYALISAELEIDPGRARLRLKQFDSVSPDRPEISYKLGLLLLQHQMPREAEAELRRVARFAGQRPGDLTPAVNLSTLFLNLAKIRFSQRDYWQVLQDLARVPNPAISAQVKQEVLLLAGQSLVAAGRLAQGLDKLKEAAETSESNGRALLHLAWAELLANELSGARDSVRKLQAKWPQTPEAGEIAALVERESLPPRAKIPWSQDWHLHGEGLVCCPCKTPCPCRSNGSPSQPHCEATGAYRIAQGHYGKVRLDNFAFVTVDANMGTSRAPLTLFVDPRATGEQLIALERIYQAFNPLQTVIFPTIVRLPLSFAAIENSRTYEVKVPGRLHLRIERQTDGQGRPRMQTAGVDPFANLLEYSQNLIYKVWDETGTLQWDFSRRQANFRFIDLDAHDYTNGNMLFEFQDGAGFFNDKQMELIKNLQLPLLPGTTEPAR